MLGDGQEFDCTATHLSPSGAEIAVRAIVTLGDHVVCRLANVGVIRGHVVRISPTGFSLMFDISNARRERIAWLAACADQPIDRREALRIVPVHQQVTVEFDDRTAVDGTIDNLSLSGAAITLDPCLRPMVGQRVKVGKRYAEIVRLLEGGIAVQFKLPFTPETFNPHVAL